MIDQEVSIKLKQKQTPDSSTPQLCKSLLNPDFLESSETGTKQP